MKKSIIALLIFLFVAILPSAIFAGENADNRSFQSVIGYDDRIPIFAPEGTIVSPIGVLLAIYPDGSISQCTGTLIDRDLVVTAGHCLERENGMRADNVFFAPAAGPDYLSPSLPYGWSWASKWTWWLPDSPGLGSDLGFVRLRQPLGDVAGTTRLFFANLNYSFYLSGWLSGWNVGYPSDLQFIYFDDVIMWASPGYLRQWSSVFSGYYVSDCDVMSGSSGGPFFIQVNGAWGIIAISSFERGEHYAWNGLGTGWGQGVNYFMPITEELYNLAIQELY
jgi:V8-like Glu-specific endopeptidase